MYTPNWLPNQVRETFLNHQSNGGEAKKDSAGDGGLSVETALKQRRISTDDLPSMALSGLNEAGVKTAHDVLTLGIHGLQKIPHIGPVRARLLMDRATGKAAPGEGEILATDSGGEPVVVAGKDGYAHIRRGHVMLKDPGSKRWFPVRHRTNYQLYKSKGWEYHWHSGRPDGCQHCPKE